MEEISKQPEICNFCGSSEDKVVFMVAGPNEYICNNCIEACMELWKDFQIDEKRKGDYVAKQRLIDNLTE